MPPIKFNSPEGSSRYYLQKLIKKQRAYRKRKIKEAKQFLSKKRTREIQDNDDHGNYPQP